MVTGRLHHLICQITESTFKSFNAGSGEQDVTTFVVRLHTFDANLLSFAMPPACQKFFNSKIIEIAVPQPFFFHFLLKVTFKHPPEKYRFNPELDKPVFTV